MINMTEILTQIAKAKGDAAANLIRPVTIGGVTVGELGHHHTLGCYVTVPKGINELADMFGAIVNTAFSENRRYKYSYFVRNKVKYISCEITSEEVPENTEIWSDAPYV